MNDEFLDIQTGAYNDSGLPSVNATQCAQALPLFFGIVPENLTNMVIDVLLQNLAFYENHMQVSLVTSFRIIAGF